ncbi:nuclear factor 7, brain-like [Seriola lalandi dorsalis]|uniref:nuclear factor 7, brain-like n=1 Tax=Seriola lalandi dorsalis TaxID=1841481 RepID=UPI000C6F58D5|nr:nuclear factor 7, brain-like [Seriola lalandi dorsalis]
MSAASCLLSEDQFLCSICLDVFTDPVSTSCGHNFCKNCITTHWNVNVPYQCPMCNEVFNIRPQFRVNTLLSEMVAQFKHEAQQKTSSSSSEQQVSKPGEVPCDVCTGTKLKALKSCLVCLTSYCETHLEPHLTLHLLQSFPSLKAAPPTKDWTEVRVRPPSYEGTVVRAVAQLEETLSEEMKKLIEAELKRVQQYAEDVTLDPDTAHPNLILSDGGKQVNHGDVRKNLTDNPERFSNRVNVLGKQSFSSGRFYFEVQVKGKTEWTLGVARESINRKGDITLRPKYGYSTIWLRNGNDYKALDEPPVRLSLKSQPEKVGVFVDHEEGLVSFYDVAAAALIYSFTGCSFTEKLYPFFSPCLSHGGKNSSPLIICPVNQTA